MKENRLLKISLLLFLNLTFFGCSSVKIDEAQKRFFLKNKGKVKYFLIEYINKNRALIGEVPTLIINKIDGQEIIRSDREFNSKLNLKRSDLIRIEILSIEKSIPLYGSAGKNGVLTIYCYGKPNL
ncbi:hypothetical protein [Flavobacterium macrobrachii]|uniref:Lipoprotein n=1 Tax=Flavobacterium macrobrachii TaxID=591204 RepID=A0ABS2D109_9FLAO|nr:hypothetical protein [Flavobacterium macrobrachii]MBM6500893.1 hypothetical protein [Flavobacterium macrobrachii]PZO29319.1 MAG: hypothetical protein DCF13_06770 [Flavobacteriaceae bacterium]